MKMRFFDFEVTPNWWLCVFGDMPDDATSRDDIPESIKNNFTIVNSDMPDCRDKLISLLREEGICVSGYNIKHYDLIIANGIYQGLNPQQVKIINDLIIMPWEAYSTKEHIRLQPLAKKRLPGVTFEDLMDDGDGSLKEKEACLGLNILESSVDFNTENMTDEDKADMTYYCKQDVYAAMIYYAEIVRPYCQTKLKLGKYFNIDAKTCLTSTNARLVALALKAKRATFSDAEKIEIELPSKIRQYCYENVPSKLLDQLLKSNENLSIRVFNNDVDYGNGGIHSVYGTDLYVESDDEFMLVNVDAESYYPSMLIQFETLTRTLEKPELFRDIFNERMRIKHIEHKTQDDEDAQLAYKLILNTTFGASGNKYLDTYDPHQCTKTCRLGQIFLTALACKLKANISGLEIIQTNTDGILAYFRRKDFDKVKMYASEWTNVSGINLEYDFVSKIWQRNVNNYLLIKEDGKVKSKGAWLNDKIERFGYVNVSPLTAFVCAKAVKNYLVNGDDIVQSIVKDKELRDFAIVCTKGPTFKGVVQRFADGHEEQLYKCNRVIASNNPNDGMIYKYKVRLDKVSYNQMPNIPEHCLLINDDLRNYDFNEIKKHIDYTYYLNRCANMLDIQWHQLKGTELISINDFNYFD